MLIHLRKCALMTACYSCSPAFGRSFKVALFGPWRGVANGIAQFLEFTRQRAVDLVRALSEWWLPAVVVARCGR